MALSTPTEPDTDGLLAQLGLTDEHPLGWLQMTPALREAECRGLCMVFGRPRPDGRRFAVAKTEAGAAAWQAFTLAARRHWDSFPTLDGGEGAPALPVFASAAELLAPSCRLFDGDRAAAFGISVAVVGLVASHLAGADPSPQVRRIERIIARNVREQAQSSSETFRSLVADCGSSGAARAELSRLQLKFAACRVFALELAEHAPESTRAARAEIEACFDPPLSQLELRALRAGRSFASAPLPSRAEGK